MVLNILLSVTSCVAWTIAGIIATVGICLLARKAICEYYGLRYIPEAVTLFFVVLAVLLSFNYIMIAKNSIAIDSAEKKIREAEMAMVLSGDMIGNEVRGKAEYVKSTIVVEAEKDKKDARSQIWVFSLFSLGELVGITLMARAVCRKNMPRKHSSDYDDIIDY